MCAPTYALTLPSGPILTWSMPLSIRTVGTASKVWMPCTASRELRLGAASPHTGSGSSAGAHRLSTMACSRSRKKPSQETTVRPSASAATAIADPSRCWRRCAMRSLSGSTAIVAREPISRIRPVIVWWAPGTRAAATGDGSRLGKKPISRPLPCQWGLMTSSRASIARTRPGIPAATERTRGSASDSVERTNAPTGLG